MLGAVAGGVAAWVARKIVTNGARIFISKIFSQKIWPKNWGGSSNRKFREWFVCGSGPAPPRPPFVQMKNTRGVFLFAGIPAAFQQRAPKSRISARAG